MIENINQILQRVLSTELLAQSPVSLAKTLGYRSVSTLYRLKSGTASDAATATFLKRLSDSLYIDGEDLRKIDTTIRNYDYLTGTLKASGIKMDPENFICAILSVKYDLLPPEFVTGELPALLKTAEEDPEAMGCTLFYYYVRRKFATFYMPRLTFQERCQRIMRPIADRLHTIFPENEPGRLLGLAYATDSAVCHEMPVLWNCITTGSAMLQYYMSPREYESTISGYSLLPGISQRSYWLSDNSRDIMLLNAISGKRHGCGYYEAYAINPDNTEVKSLCTLAFDCNGYVAINWRPSAMAQIGAARLTGNTLIIDYENTPREVKRLAGRWTRLDVAHNTPLRDLDDELTESHLRRAVYLAEGVEELPGHTPADVVISRQGLDIILENGARLRISRDRHGFLAAASPDDTVAILRRLSDGYRYVHWQELNMSLPLAAFTLLEH